MVRAFCPWCEGTPEVTPDKLWRDGRNRWWRLVVHKAKNEEKVCDGSGRTV